MESWRDSTEPFFVTLSCCLALILCPAFQAAEPSTPAVIESEGPAQLLDRGRAAFFANDFPVAEQCLEKFIVEYGPAEEVAEAVRQHRPLVAIAKVAQAKYAEALPWIDDSLSDPQITPRLADELHFCRGLCLMAQGEWVASQRAFGEYWINESHDPAKRFESMLLFASLYLKQDFPTEAADLLEEQRPLLLTASPEVASRAALLEVTARIEAGEDGKALAIIRRESPNLGKMMQLASFQSLVLRLGAKFLEAEQFYEAITCFQRIWPKQRILDHQAARIAEIESRIATLEKQPEARGTVSQLRAILDRTQQEMERFAEIENFDSSVRLRLAMAFQSLGRYREAALILAEMLANLPPDAVVESASLAEVQCWMETKNWKRASEAADRYLKVFAARPSAEAPSLATVLFLRADALREAEDYSEAQRAFGDLVTRFPDDPVATKAVFLQGFLYLQQDDNEGALYQFEQVRRRDPKSSLVDDADYWSAMAESFSAEYDEARESLTAYLKKYGDQAKCRVEASFRIAFCTFSLGDYEEAVTQLEEFLRRYPDDSLTDEANLLRGDALFGLGRSEEGLAAYDQVSPQSVRYFEDAWFKKGKALRLLDEVGQMREHFEKFVAEYPESGRLPEAIYWIGWAWQQEGAIERARDIYWDTIEKMGDDPTRRSMTDLLAGLPRVYASGGAEGKAELVTKLRLLRSRAGVSDRRTLALRAGWALSLAVSPERARTELLDITKWLDPKRHEPAISVAIAEAQLASGNRLVAKNLLLEIRRWHPRAVERDRIYGALGEIVAEEGDIERALGYYRRFERETTASTRLGVARLRMSELLESLGRVEEARETLEKALADSATTAAVKADALLHLGRSYAKQGKQEKASFYYERIYVAYGGLGEINAKAYWERGQALEKLHRLPEAVETYGEFVARTELNEFPQYVEAQRRIDILKRELPQESPAESPGKEGSG